MKLIDNELGGTTPMDIILNLIITQNSIDDDFDDYWVAMRNSKFQLVYYRKN